MKCKYCGYSLSNNSAICPHCGMLMDEEQLKNICHVLIRGSLEE